MADNFYLKAIITAVDKISPALKSIGEQAKATRGLLGNIAGPEFRQGFGDVGKQIRNVRGNLNKFGQSLKEVGKNIAIFSAAAGVVGYGMASIVMKTTDTAGALDDLALRTGMSAEELQKWGYAALQTGISNEEFYKSLEIMNKNMGALKSGTGPLAQSISKISPALSKQLKGAKDNTEAFEIMLKAIRQVPDVNKRAYLATQFFGKSGMPLINLAAESEESLIQLRKRAQELGILSNQDVAAAAVFGDRIDDLKTKWGDVKDTFSTGLIPYLTPMVSKLTDFLVNNKELINKLVNAVVKPIGNWLENLDFKAITEDILDFIETIKSVVNFLGGFKRVSIAIIILMNTGLIKSIFGVAMAFKGLLVAMGPVGIAIALLAAAAYLLITHWDTVSAWLKETWNGIVDAFYETVGALGDALYPETIVKAWNGLKDFFKCLWDNIKQIFTDAINWIGNLVSQFNPVQLLTGKISELFPNGFTGINTSGPSLVQRQAQATAQQQQRVSGNISVSFDNAPPGMRVSEVTDGNGFGLNTNVGYRTTGSVG